jgi:uncharacterized protein
VMAVARRVCDRLIHAYPQLRAYRTPILCGALLHDLGHGPFSHTGEDIFQSNHELWTLRILQEEGPVAKLLTHASSSLIQDLTEIYQKIFPLPLAWQLVSSQLDCDRLDYLMRDSYFTGAAYGNLDLDRILLALDYDPVSRQLVVIRKGLAAIEHYLVVRSFMYSQVYNHPKNIAAAWLLEQIFSRAKTLLGKIPTDATVTAWLGQPIDQLHLDQYLAGDDIVFTYHLQQWQSAEDLELADLCRRYLNRDLPKALEITHFPPAQQQQLQEQAQDFAAQCGFSPAYIGRKVAHSRGYTLYQRGIKLQTSQGLQEISEVSPLVQTLTHPQAKVLLLYPREIEAALLNVLG